MKRPEEALQREFVTALRAMLPWPWIVFHVPNGAGRSKAEAGILKAMGVRAGCPDLLMIGPQTNGRAGNTTIAIELKAPPKRLRSGALSRAKPASNANQQSFQADLEACGVPVLIVRDVKHGFEALRALGVPLKGRVM